MNGTNDEFPSATYKTISEKDMEEEAGIRSKNAVSSKNKESDGADEKMLPHDETKISPNSEISLKDVIIVKGEKNGDAKLDIAEPLKHFGGMTKEELMKYADDPFWVRLRWFLFITFWLLWAGMLIGAIMIIYSAPKCDPPPPRTWWEVGPLAVLNQDAKPEDLESIKNIKGLIVIWNEDAYKPIDESHNVIQLIKKSKELNEKIIVELDPSTSERWFNESENNKSAYVDYYIWRAPKYNGQIKEPPNNWFYQKNMLNSSWTYSSLRDQYYYAPLSKPHLNFRNDIVVKQFAEVVKKFMDLGASGVRIRNAPLLLVDPNFKDETQPSHIPGVFNREAGFFVPNGTVNHPDLGALLSKWKQVIINNTADGLLMVTEELTKAQSYQVNDSLVVDLPLITNSFEKYNVSVIVKKLEKTFNMDHVKWPLWKETSLYLPADVISIVTGLLPGASLVEVNATVDPRLLKLRESPSIMRGSCEMFAINDTVFMFIREITGNPGVLVALNTGDQTVTLNIQKEIPSLSNLNEVTIQHYSSNYNETAYKDVNSKKSASKVLVSPKSVLVLQYVPKKN